MLDSSQPATQNPQTSAISTGIGGDASQVQPVSSTDALSTSQSGIPLIVNSLPVVSLTNTSTSTQAVTQPITHHKTNYVLLGFAGVLFVTALVLFWIFSRQAKDIK